MKTRWMMMALLILLAVGASKKTGETTVSQATPAAAPAREAKPAADAETEVEQPAAAQASSGGTSIVGQVLLEGTPPAREKIRMAADPVCHEQHKEPVLSEQVVANKGNLQNVFVHIKEGLGGKAFPAPTTPVVLNQEGCQYKPHLFGIQVGQPLEIVNGDPTLHNINAQPKTNKRFNIAQPLKGMKTTKRFDKPEMAVPFKCNVHPWMAAYGHVLEHPFFAVTDSEGNFTLIGLPAGTYTVEAWHEKFGAKSQTIRVGDGETKKLTFLFQAQ